YPVNFTGGVRVAAAYINSDSIADLIVARGPGGISDAIVFNGTTSTVIYQGQTFVSPLVIVGSFPSSGKFFSEALRLSNDVDLPTESPAPITIETAQPLFDAALVRLEEVGVSQEIIEELSLLNFQVTDLGGNTLGLAQGNTIVIDDDAAGVGYFVDPTPYENEEYDGNGLAILNDATSRVDLLTVILHELGHHLGLEDLDPATHPHELMAGYLTPGERRLPTQQAVETLFSGDELFDRLLAPSLF
ncbi:MAG: hypothetical protein KDA84_24685, partial [Planctomycetaceae bacterium]|nr:hypothetical protein [Planctomycetaceae bacterium]